MSLKKYLLTMLLATILGASVWVYVIFTVDPIEGGLAGLLFFYLSLLGTLIGAFSIIGFYLRRLFFRNELEFRQATIAFRQSVLFSILVILSLILQSHGLLRWWNAILLILALTLLEFFLVANKERR